MDRKEIPDDTMFMMFGVADKLRQIVLQDSTSKKNLALLESLTYRQHKALLAVRLLTENMPVGVNLKKLAERMNMTVPATSVLVESMVQHKIFLRVTSQTDRRAVCIKLSDFGNNIMNNLQEKMNEYIANLYLGVSNDEKAIFSEIIRRFHDKLFPDEVKHAES